MKGGRTGRPDRFTHNSEAASKEGVTIKKIGPTVVRQGNLLVSTDPGHPSHWPTFRVVGGESPGQRFKKLCRWRSDVDVASEYYKLLCGISVSISREKSWISDCGCFEFAKLYPEVGILFYLCSDDCGASEFYSCRSRVCSDQDKFLLAWLVGSAVSVIYRVAGFHRSSRRWLHHLLVMLSPSGVYPLPLVLWLGYPDRIVDCYTLGVVRCFLLSKLKPNRMKGEIHLF